MIPDSAKALVRDIAVKPRALDAGNGSGRTQLIGLNRAEIAQKLLDSGEAAGTVKMRAGQVWHWLYYRGAREFGAMSSIAKPMRQRLAEHFEILRPEIATSLISQDGSRKWLLRFADGEEAECVHIPERDRGALCVSSQVGCTLNCRFCHTGTQALVRNLTADEIIGQILIARDAINEWPAPATGRMISNIVMMGMGEPLYNLDNVIKALKIVMDAEGLSISKRRITLSTAGVVPMIERAGRELGVNLAVSLHAVRDEVRNELVPLNKKYPIAQLLAACRTYPGAHNARRITFEYAMLKSVNDSPADARELVALLKGLPAKVNLIPFNPWPGAPYECSTNAAIARFAEIVNAGGLSAPVRNPRGRDIMAACGQLKSASIKKRRGEVAQSPAAQSPAARATR
jgi:23S rRNA (adenine2503-C2)-methyltransferase